MRKSILSILLWEGGGVWGHITQLHRWATHVTFMKLIISEALHVKFNLPALRLISNIYYGGAWGTTKVHMFNHWTTMAPPEELTGPWDQGVSITVGPNVSLRGEWIAYNTQIKLLKTYLALCQCVCTSALSRTASRSSGQSDFSSVELLSCY